MNFKTLGLSAVMIMLLSMGVYFFISKEEVGEMKMYKESEVEEMSDSDEMKEIDTTPGENMDEEMSQAGKVENTNVDTKINEVSDPVAADTETKSEAGITLAMVATHNSEASCWSVIEGNVYDLTSFIKKHPGGAKNILKICGKDGTNAFMGQHEGQGKPEATLEGFFIGKLSN